MSKVDMTGYARVISGVERQYQELRDKLYQQGHQYQSAQMFYCLGIFVSYASFIICGFVLNVHR